VHNNVWTDKLVGIVKPLHYINFTLVKSMQKFDFNQTFWHVSTRNSGEYTDYIGELYNLYFWAMGLTNYKECAAFFGSSFQLETENHKTDDYMYMY
jgi:hypothetical protein